MFPLLLLVACGGDGDRDLSVVEPHDSRPDPDSGDSAADDTAGDTAVDTGGLETRATTRCAGGEAEPLTGDDVLAVDWCARVSPEEAYGPDTGGGETGGQDTYVPPPPCGFVNLIGSVATAGAVDDPALLYCDNDNDGGLRFVRYDRASGTVSTRTVDPGSCLVDFHSGALLPFADGFLVAWSRFYDGESGVSATLVARLDADGAVVQGPVGVSVLAPVRRVSALPTDPPLLLLQDEDGTLWSWPVSAEGEVEGDPFSVAFSTRKLGWALDGAGARLAWCDEDDALHLARLDVTGALSGEHTLDGARCGWDSSPSLALLGGTLGVTWDDGVDGWFAREDADGALLGVTWLGENALYPQVVADGEALLTADTSGLVRRWGADGTLLLSRTHPWLPVEPGSLSELRLSYADGVLGLTTLGMDSYPLGYGHVNSYNYLEISSGPAPR